MDYLSSMYIDDEMDLDEKHRFVEKVRSDHTFYTLTLALLEQEKLLRQPLVVIESSAETRFRSTMHLSLVRLFKPLGYAVAGFATAMLLFFAISGDSIPAMRSNRFILFEPAADRVELAGSFTDWQPMTMRRIGESGYWELNLTVPSGEHRFAYILDGNRRMADPTLPAIEKDDFGGENSILTVEDRI